MSRFVRRSPLERRGSLTARGFVLSAWPMTENIDAAHVLALARKAGTKLAGYPCRKPESMEAAWSLQHEVTLALAWKPCGWKVGATSPTAQAILHLEQPYAAPLYAERLFSSGADVPADASTLRIVEPEIAFRMRASLPARGEPFSTEEVLRAVGSVHPALELVSSRLPHGLDEPAEWIIADGGINDGLVLGPAAPPPPAASYATIHVRARRNGEWTTAGVGANVMGGPEKVLTWLANHLRERGIALEEGQIVSTGLLTGLIQCPHGDEIEACFEGIGGVRARV